MNNEPLVSICVIAYNSSRYILNALESAKSQSYKNIELIVSDDASTDNTVEICSNWINDNKALFVNAQLVTTLQNTGVSANCNRAIQHATGEWIKIIAGDDILMANCISDFVYFVHDNPSVKVCFSNMKVLLENQHGEINDKPLNERTVDFFKKSSEEQFKTLLNSIVPYAPTSFIKSEIFKEYQFNESYPFVEDAPMWIRLTRDGIKLHFLNKTTVIYRMGDSLANNNSGFFSQKFAESANLFFWNERLKYIREMNLIKAYDRHRKDMFLRDVAELFFHNKRNKINNTIYKIIEYCIRKFTFFQL